MLHRHALESIFACLSFDELRSVLLVSRRWLAAVYSMRGLKQGKRLWSTVGLTAVLASRLARHVSSIGRVDFVVEQVSLSQLQQIAVSMPFLQQLHIAPSVMVALTAAPRFPATLRTVTMRFAHVARLHTVVFTSFPPSLSSLDFLASLPVLATLSLSAQSNEDAEEGIDVDDAARMNGLLQALSVTLPRVTSLSLTDSALDTQQLKTLMVRLPQLCMLRLECMRHFDALAFLNPVRDDTDQPYSLLLQQRRSHSWRAGESSSAVAPSLSAAE